MKTHILFSFVGILSISICCSEIEKKEYPKEPETPKFNQISYSDDTKLFRFSIYGGQEKVFPIMDELENIWGRPSIYSVKIRRNKLSEFFVSDEYLSDFPNRSSFGIAYSYLYCWTDEKFPRSSGTSNSISIFINPRLVGSPLWEDLYPEDWDSMLPFRAIAVTDVEIRISQDQRNELVLNSIDIEAVEKTIQPLIDQEIGTPMECIPPKQHFIDLFELYNKREEIKKRFPPEMQGGSFPIVGIPRDRNEIDLRVSFTYPVPEKIEYKVQITDSLNRVIDYKLYASDKRESQNLEKIIIPKSLSNSNSLNTYIYHIRLSEPNQVKKITFKRNNGQEYLIFLKGEETTTGFLLEDASMQIEKR